MADPSLAADYIGWRLRIFAAFFIPLQIIAVILRFYARWLVVGTKFSIDDGLVLITLILQLIQSAVGLASVSNAGVGHHLAYLQKNDPEKLVAWGKYLLIIATLYFFIINLPKLAILILYKRIFPMRMFQYIVFTLAAILICATIAGTTTSLAACQPFEANWIHTIPGAKCIDKEKFYVWTSIPNIFTDLVMLILPLPSIWQLHSTLRIKMALTFTFLVGSFGLVTSILRFHTFFTTNSFNDGTYDAVELIIWTVTEPGIYLISACMVTYRPVLEKLSKSQPIAMLKGTKLRSQGASSSDNANSNERNVPLRKMRRSGLGFTELDDEETIGIVDMTRKESPASDPPSQHSIKVTTDIESRWSAH